MSGDWPSLGNRPEQQGRQGEAEQAHREAFPAVQAQQWPLTAAATQILLALPEPSAPKGADAGATVPALADGALSIKELIVRGAYRAQVGLPSRVFRDRKVVLLPQQPPWLPGSLAELDQVLRPHTPADVGTVIKHACRACGLWAGGEKLAGRLGILPWNELAERGLVEQGKQKMLGFVSYPTRGRTASGHAWAHTAEQHVQRLQGLPQEAENDPRTAAWAAAAAGALVLLVPAVLPSLARLSRRSRRRGGDLDLDFAYHSDGVAFDPFNAVGDLFASALEGGIEGIDAVSSALDKMDEWINFDRGLKTWKDYGGGAGGGSGSM